jgi:hypothetical protein
MAGFRCRLITAAALVLLAPEIMAQGVAFQPVVGAIPNGPSLSVTPVVSFDRRYVRLGINPQFLAVQGFNTYLVPAAVSSGPSGPGAVGGQFLAGMNGVIAPGMDTGNAGLLSNPGFNGNLPGSDLDAMAARPQLDYPAPPRAAAAKTPKRGRGTRAKSTAKAATTGPAAKPR